jgi:hypothetical protein
MKSVTYLFLGICLAFFGLFGYWFLIPTGSAQKAVSGQWEYSVIIAAYSFNPTKDRTNKIPGSALICYLQNSGCRITEIKHEVDYTVYLQDRGLAVVDTSQTRSNAGIRASEIAFQKAVAQLGSEGWEMIGEPHLEFEFVDYDSYLKIEDKSVFFNRKNTKAVYFKRLKTQ